MNNEHTQFFGAPGEPAPKSPPPAPPKMPVAATPPPPPPPVAVVSKPQRDNSKLVGALAIGAVAVGSVGFVSWSMLQEEELPAVSVPSMVPKLDTLVVPELPKEELVETPPPIVAEIPLPAPPAPKHIASAPKPKPEFTPLATPVLPVDINVAKVSDDDEFKDAFLDARDQVGPGGLFEYKGQWYSTFSLEEWNKMPKEMQDEFTNRIDPVVNQVDAQEAETTIVEEPIVLRLDTDNDGKEDTIMSDTNHDGLADIVIKDEPGEGISSIMYVDKDHDGKLETAIPVSDEGVVLEGQTETVEVPFEIKMQTTGVIGSNELSEVVELDIEGIYTLETAMPINQEDNLMMAQATDNVLNTEMNTESIFLNNDSGTEDLFTT